MTTSDTRDPKTDPAPGDVLANRAPGVKHLHREVVSVINGVIEYKTLSGRLLTCFGNEWRKWAAGTDVIGTGRAAQ